MSQKVLLISATDTLCHGVRTLYPGARPAATKHTHAHKTLGTQTKTWNLQCKTGKNEEMKKYPKQNARAHTHNTKHTKHKTQKKITKKHKNQLHTSNPTKSSPSTRTAMYHLPQKEAHNRKRVPRKKGEKTSPTPRKEKKKTKVGNR
jgi:hypothetical protein